MQITSACMFLHNTVFGQPYAAPNPDDPTNSAMALHCRSTTRTQELLPSMIRMMDLVNSAVNPTYHVTAPSLVHASAPNPNTPPMQQHALFQLPMPYQLSMSPTTCMITNVGQTVLVNWTIDLVLLKNGLSEWSSQKEKETVPWEFYYWITQMTRVSSHPSQRFDHC